VPLLESSIADDWEIILIDDGSHDASWDTICSYCRRDVRIRGIALSRNFGHQAALDAGLAFAGGDYVGVMDCDLQDPPDVLVELLKKAHAEDLDVCYAVRGTRDAPLMMRFLYAMFYRMMRAVAESEWVLDAGDFSVVNRRTLQAILSMPENIRVLRGLRAWVGLKQGYVRYARPPRRHGQSKYSVHQLFALAIRSCVGFSGAPLRLASYIGFAMAGMAILLAVFFLTNRFIPDVAPFGYYIGENPGTTTIVLIMLLISSALFACIGVIGEYLAVILHEIKGRPAAIVKNVAGTPRLQAHRFPLIVLPPRE
jgi:dolichol-phosphate mannosyltransferase